MSEYKLFEGLLDQIFGLLQTYNEKKSQMNKEEIPPELLDKLPLIQKAIENLNAMNEVLMAKSGVTQEELREIIAKPPDTLPLYEKRLLEKANLLKKEVETVKNELDNQMMCIQLREEKFGKGDKKQGDVRKKKFNKLGGKKNWLPS